MVGARAEPDRVTGGRDRRRWCAGGLATVAGFAAVTACAGSGASRDTLAPLPISVAVTTSTPDVTTSPLSSSTVESTTETSATSETTGSATLVGDWDGAEFDVGAIHGVGELGGYRTINFDRYSYRDPERGVIDAAGFVEEPIAYGWTDSPFVNIQEQLRTFVLADDVEVLVLGGAAAGRSCRDRRPLPPADWIDVGVSFLDRPAVRDDVASLTYSDDGLVTRIRFTRGCVG
jgi:hypothetical protein